MKNSIYALRNYKLSLQNINHNASSRIDNTISDNIRIDHRNNQSSFFLISTKGDTKGKYLSSKNGGKELAAKIAQNQYYKKVLNRTAYLIKKSTSLYQSSKLTASKNATILFRKHARSLYIHLSLMINNSLRSGFLFHLIQIHITKNINCTKLFKENLLDPNPSFCLQTYSMS